MLFQNWDLEKITTLGCQKICKILFQPTCNAVYLELKQQNVTKLKMQGLISRKVKKNVLEHLFCQKFEELLMFIIKLCCFS